MKGRMLVGLFVGIMLLVFSGYMSESNAGVHVGTGVNIQPPRVMLPGPPDVVVIPKTYVYFVPGINFDIFFYHGYWYRPYKGYWYRATGYNGPWVYIARPRVPSVLINLPPDYRQLPPGYEHIPHHMLRKNWRTWEKNRYWDRPPLPRIVFPGPPDVVVIPGMYVYFVPNINFDIFFYRGYWYRPYKGYWYRATGYDGPWVYIARARVPSVLINLPPDYRQLPPGYKHIPHRLLKKNWMIWEKNRSWDRKGYKRQDIRPDTSKQKRQDTSPDTSKYKRQDIPPDDLERQEERQQRKVY